MARGYPTIYVTRNKRNRKPNKPNSIFGFLFGYRETGGKKITDQGKSNRLQIDRDEGIFVKTKFGLNESRAKLLLQLKTHMRGATSAMLEPCLPIYEFR